MEKRYITEAGCWISVAKQIHFRGRAFDIDRLAALAWLGAPPPRRVVGQVCGNARCFNPEHLEYRPRRGPTGTTLTDAHKRAIADAKRLWWQTRDTTETRRKIGDSSKGRGLGRVGDKSPAWKGGRYTQKRDGYVYVYAPSHPCAKRNGKGGGGYVLEHRLVMEKILGRYLLPEEDVNHRLPPKSNNDPSNLVIVRHNAHFTPMRCPRCEFEFWVR